MLVGGRLGKSFPGYGSALVLAGALVGATLPAGAQFKALEGKIAPSAGTPSASALAIQDGSRTMFVELEADKAMVRFAAGSSAGEDLKVGDANPLTGVAMVEAREGSALAAGAKSAGGLHKVLAGRANVEFSGPVYKAGDRLLGVGDQLILKFDDASDAAKFCGNEGLEIVRAESDGLCIARLATSDGGDTVAKAASLAGVAGLSGSGVDWYSFYELDNYTDDFGGTSSAAPTVSGVAGLVLSADQNQSYSEVLGTIRGTAEKIDEAGGQYVGNRSPFYGFGNVNAYNAVADTLGIELRGGGAAFPNDPGFPFQWHLDASSVGAAVEEADIDAPEAWSLVAPAPGLTIGVIDSGVIMDHPDLNVVAGRDVLLARNTAQPVGGGEEEHGTSVAGVAAAIGNNQQGTVGVAPGARVVGVRLISPTSLVPIFSSNIEDAFRFCTFQGAWVINNSWGPVHPADFCTDADDFQDIPATFGELLAVDFALEQGRGGRGAVIVFSAGNSRALTDGYELHALPDVLTVSALNNLAKRSIYSNYGVSIDVCAPTNDFPIPSLPCNDSIWTGGTLGITTTDGSFLNMGGVAFDLGNGGAGVTGYRDINSMLNIPMNGPAIGLGGYVLGHPVFEGFFIALDTTVDESGSVSGFLDFFVADQFGNLTYLATTDVSGKLKYTRKGVYLEKDRTRASISLTGRGVNASGKYSFSAKGRENITVENGVLTQGGTGFLQKVKAVVAGEKAQDTVLGLGADQAVTSMYVPNALQNTAAAKRQGKNGRATYAGTFKVLTEFRDTLTGTGSVQFTPLSLKQGQYRAQASIDQYRAKVSGQHRLFELTLFDFLQFYSVSDSVSFRGPAGQTNLKIPIGPGDVPGPIE